MMSDTIARAFRQWLDGDDAAEETVRRLADAEVWPPLPLGSATTRRLIALAHDALSRDPNRAVWISRLAIRVAREGEALADEGDAWREYAAALFEVGEYHDAKMAVERARLVYLMASDAEHNQAVLSAIEGRVLHELGDSIGALQCVEASAQTLLRLNDKKTYVRVRTIYASIQFNLGRYREAAETYAAMAVLAEQEGDSETLAHAVHVIGRCAVKLGEMERGRQCFETALEMFDQLGLRPEIPRVRKGFAEILIAQGRVHEAISELYKARAEFLAMALPVIAALVALDIVDLLLRVGRTSEIELLCDDQLPRSASNAFAGLRDLACRTAVTGQDVQRVRDFLERLPMEA
jgi:tetratricopeptide (TPR) repeat protein